MIVYSLIPWFCFSVEMLTDEQISSLMLEQDLQEVCQQVLGTPINEIAPYYTSSAVTQ